MAEIVREGVMCECCALMVANDDESGCRDYYGHTHQKCTLPLGTYVSSEDESEYWGYWTCEGCGQEMLPGAVQFEFIVLE